MGEEWFRGPGKILQDCVLPSDLHFFPGHLGGWAQRITGVPVEER